MRLCVAKTDTPHKISFDICEEDITFKDSRIHPDGWVSIPKELLRQMTALLTDPEWVEKLGIAPMQDHPGRIVVRKITPNN